MAREIIGISVCFPPLSLKTRVSRLPLHIIQIGQVNSPRRWQTYHPLTYGLRNRLATKSEKTSGGPFSRSTVLEMTGYGVFLHFAVVRGVKLSRALLFNSRTSGMIHSKFNG